MNSDAFVGICVGTIFVAILSTVGVYVNTEYGRNAKLYRTLWFTMLAFVAIALGMLHLGVR